MKSLANTVVSIMVHPPYMFEKQHGAGFYADELEKIVVYLSENGFDDVNTSTIIMDNAFGTYTSAIRIGYDRVGVYEEVFDNTGCLIITDYNDYIANIDEMYTDALEYVKSLFTPKGNLLLEENWEKIEAIKVTRDEVIITIISDDDSL